MRLLALVLLAPVLLSGCALQGESEVAAAQEAARYALRFDHVVDAGGQPVGRVLADCSEKTVKAETACVRQALDTGSLTVAALATSIPNCRVGTICRYDHTTQDRLGFVRATAVNYTVRWRVLVDLRHPGPTTAGLPAAVVDRDDFDSPIPDLAKTGKGGPAK